MSPRLIYGQSLNGYIKRMANPTLCMYRLEKDGTYTPLTKTQYESETTSSYAKGSTYRDRVEQLIKKVNNHERNRC